MADQLLSNTSQLAGLLRAAPNFRDVGGLPTADGRWLRPGLLYRSDALDELDDEDLLRIERLAIKVCCDLRSDGERIQRPSRWPEHAAPRTLAMPVATDIRVLMPEIVQQLRQDPSGDGASQLMRHLYRDLPVVCAPVLARLFVLMTDEADALPLVVHCTAGKDRTGFIIAMMLHAVGVPPDTISDDYLLTNQRPGRGQSHAKVGALLHDLLGMAAAPEMLGAIMAARPDYLDAAYARIHEDYGSIDQYLIDAAGLDLARRQLLQTRLLMS